MPTMERPKHIFAKSVRQNKNLWGVYVAFVWVFFISIGLLDQQINSAAGPPNPVSLYGAMAVFGLMLIMFIYCMPLGWCLIMAVFIVNTGGSIIGIFTTLASAKLDGEHIIGMAKSSAGTSLGIIMLIYLCQSFIREIYSIGGKKTPPSSS